MRIAQIAPLVESIPPARYGGTERIIAAVATELAALGHEVTVYASGDSDVDGRLVPVVDRALWRENRRINHSVVTVAELARVAREEGEYDIIHSHVDFLAFPFARGASRPWLHTMHGRLDLPELQQLTREFPEPNLVSISHSQRRPLPRANWVGNVYNGTTVEAFPYGDGRGDYLAFVGRISPEKGVADAIDVAIKADMPIKIAARMPLECVDSPWVQQDWDYYNEVIKRRLDHPLVEFVGEVDDISKGELLKDARALIFPINWPEPFGLVMIEALSCGTPVIARPLGSVPEVIEDGRTGLLATTIDEMVEACRRVDQIDRAICRAQAEERFSQRAMALAYVDVYRSLCEEHSIVMHPEYPVLSGFAMN